MQTIMSAKPNELHAQLHTSYKYTNIYNIKLAYNNNMSSLYVWSHTNF